MNALEITRFSPSGGIRGNATEQQQHSANLIADWYKPRSDGWSDDYQRRNWHEPLPKIKLLAMQMSGGDEENSSVDVSQSRLKIHGPPGEMTTKMNAVGK